MTNPKHITVKQYSSKQLLRLIRRVLRQIPENDTLGYRQRQMAIDWHEVAFGVMDLKECQRVGLLLVRKAQRLQTLPGLLKIAKEAITKLQEGQNESAPPTVSNDLKRAYGSYIRTKLKGVSVDERTDVRISCSAEWKAMSVDDKLTYLPKKREKKNDGPRLPPAKLYNFFVSRYLKALDSSTDRKEAFKQASITWRGLSEIEKSELQRLWEKAQRRYAKRYRAFLETLPPEEKEAKLRLSNFKRSKQDKTKMKRLRIEAGHPYWEQKKVIDDLMRTCPQKPPKTLYHYFMRTFAKAKAKAGEKPRNVMSKASKAWKEITEDERARLKHHFSKAQQRYMRMHAVYLNALHEENEKLDQLKNQWSENANESTILSNSLIQDDTADVTVEPEEDFDRLDDTSNLIQDDTADVTVEPEEDFDRLDDTSNIWTDPEENTESFSADLVWTDPEEHTESFSASPKKKKRKNSHHCEENNLENSDGYNEWNEQHRPLEAPVEPPKKKKKRKKHNFEENNLENSDCVRTDPEEHTEILSASPKKKKRKKSHHSEETNLENSDCARTDNEEHTESFSASQKKKKRKKSHHSEETNLENSDCARTDPEEHTESFSASPYNERHGKHTPLEAPVEPPKTPMNLFLRNHPEMTELDWTELSEKKKKYYQKALKRLQQAFLVQYEAYLETLPRESLAEHVLRMRNESF